MKKCKNIAFLNERLNYFSGLIENDTRKPLSCEKAVKLYIPRTGRKRVCTKCVC